MTLIQRLSVSATIRNIIIFYLVMKKNKEDLDLADIFTHETTLRALSEVFRQKDYNKIGNKLRNYQHIVLTLQAPLFSDISHLAKIDSSLTLFNHVYSELQLTCDEIIDDIAALGFRNYSEMFDGLMQTIRMMHEFMQRTVKEGIHLNTANVFKSDKAASNLCQLCHEIQEANHLKKIKRQFGLDYQLSQDLPEDSKILKKEEDQAIKEAEDFIEQLNGLLARKDRLINLPLNTYKLNALVDSLNKLSDFSEDICRSNERRKKTLRNNTCFPENFKDQNEQLSRNHDKIVQQVRQILNSKFKEGYSMRIRKMLQKFQAALSEDKTLKVQKKSYINVCEDYAQTNSTPESVQIKLLTEELKRKEQQIEGIKDNRNKMEERFMKILENQRKIIKDLSASKHQTAEHQSRSKLFEAAKKEKEVRFEIDQIKEVYEYSSVFSNNNLTSSLNLELTSARSSGNDDLRNRQPSNKSKKDLSSLRFATSDKYIQTDPELSDEYLLENLPIEDDSVVKQLAVKKKRLWRFSRAVINKFMFDSLNLSKQTSLKDQITIISKVYTITLIGKFQKHDKEVQVGQHCVASNNTNNECLESDVNIVSFNSGALVKKEKRSIEKGGKWTKKQVNQVNQENKRNISIRLKQKAEERDQQNLIQQNLLKGDNQTQDGVIQTHKGNSSAFSQRNSNTQKLSRFAIPNLKSSEFSKTAKAEFTYANKIRLTEVPNKRGYIVNQPKANIESTAEDNSEAHHIISKNNKQNKIIINKFQRKSSSSMDKSKVREIVSLLRSQKKAQTYKVRNSRAQEKVQHLQPGLKSEDMLQSNQQESRQLQSDLPEKEQKQRQSIIEQIICAKSILQAEYTYLKAAGFINYLFSLDHKVLNPSRTVTKGVFNFRHIDEKDIELFGGIEEMLGYRGKKGRWKDILEEEVELKINCKNYHFAAKICRYLHLLNKMNRRYYKEYTSFLKHPVDFCEAHFAASDDFQQRILHIRSNDQSNVQNWDADGQSKEEELNLIIMRVINFHHKFHHDCGHVASFLQKIGFYRYAM